MNKRFGSLSSSQDLQSLSLTVKAIGLGLLPLVKTIFGIEIGSEQLDAVIDAAITLIAAGLAVYGYSRSKQA